MSTIYYPSGCDTDVPAHVCNPCEEVEHGRVRSVAFISKGFTFTDPTDPTEWQAGIDTGEIRIIPETLGAFDGGAPVEETGFGDLSTRLTGYDFSLTFKDPNYKDNCAFYDALKNSRNWRVAWRTEKSVHISEASVQALPKNPITEELTSVVAWDTEVKWTQSKLHCPYDVPAGIFDCFALTPFAAAAYAYA
jgi:hypothetical protein